MDPQDATPFDCPDPDENSITTYKFEGYKYQVRNGVIVSPGKFEGEPIFVLHFWSMAGDGGYDELDDEQIYWFNLTDGDREDYPDLQNAARLGIWEDDQGFVHHATTSESPL